MINEEIVEFIKKQTQSGHSSTEIKTQLLENGWAETDIDMAILRANLSSAPSEALPVQPSQPTKVIRDLILVVVLLLLGAGILFAYEKFSGIQVPTPIVTEGTTDTRTDDSSLINTSATRVDACTSASCFVNAIKSCSETQYENESTVEFLGSNIKSRIHYELTQSDTSCSLSMTIASYNISPSQNLLNDFKNAKSSSPDPSTIYPQLNQDAQTSYVGKRGVCNITNDRSDISDLISKNSGVFLILDPDYNRCSGDLFSKPQTTEDKIPTAPKTQTMNDCKNITSSQDRAECIKKIVATIGDCDIFSFSLDRQSCIKQLALKQKSVSTCSLVASPEVYSSIQADCYGEVAALNNDYKICGVDGIAKIKNSQQVAENTALACVKTYCSIRGTAGWWGCSNN